MTVFEVMAHELGARAQLEEPLAPHTTFRIGGPAALYTVAHKIHDLTCSVQLARARSVPIFILGNGSNILVRDGGIRAYVIKNHCQQFTVEAANSTRAILSAESGVSMPLVANKMAREGWAGLEWAIGVPGTIGAGILGNAGAHGECVADSLVNVSILDAAGDMRELQKAELGFDYRTSRLRKSKETVVLSARFELHRDNPNACIARMNAYTGQRRRTQPSEPSVGSIFKNPPGDYAGRLIEEAGLKEARVGNVQVSKVHANFFVNQGGATAKDALELIDLVRARVYEKFSVELELEIEVVGE